MRFGATSATNRQIRYWVRDLMLQYHFSYCHIFFLNRLNVLLGTGFSVAVVGATNVAVTDTCMIFFIFFYFSSFGIKNGIKTFYTLNLLSANRFIIFGDIRYKN